MARWLHNKRKENGTENQWRLDRQMIVEFNRSLTVIEDVEALMASVAARIRDLVGTERAVILRASSTEGMLRVAFSRGFGESELNDLRIGASGRLAWWLLRNQTVLVVKENPDVVGYLGDIERTMIERLGIQLCVPLVALNRLTGLILLSSSQRDWSLNQQELGMIQMLASQASIAFETACLFEQQRERLRKLHRVERLAAAGELAASVAHEVRNPLTTIRSTVQYLLGDMADVNPKRALVETVISEVDRIDRIVEGLLTLTKPAELRPCSVELAEVMDQCLVLVSAQARSQGVQVHWQPQETPVRIIGDPSELKQLFLNLILNALQAMPAGGELEIGLSVTGSSEGTPRALILVRDTGCGIPDECVDRVFDPFFTTKQGGTGLGLSISYAIVRRYMGELELKSKPGEGTAATVLFPLAM